MMIHGQNAKARGKMKIYGIFSNVCRYKKEKMSDCGRWNGCTAQSAGTAGFWSGRVVVAPEVISKIKEYPVTVYQRNFEKEDLQGCELVVAATDDAGLNHEIAEAAQKQKIPVNAVDQQEDCSFIFPSYVREQELVGAFSSGGNSPVLTQYLKKYMAQILTAELGEANAYLGSIRPVVKRELDTETMRKKVYQQVLNELFKQIEKKQDVKLSRQQLQDLIDDTKKEERGR